MARCFNHKHFSISGQHEVAFSYQLIYNFEKVTNSSRIQVRDFLVEVKQTIAESSGRYPSWHLVGRLANIACASQLGLTFKGVRDVILDLSVEDYCEGPCRDLDNVRGDLWVFGKYIGNVEIYIKLKLASFGDLKVVRIISFHFAKEPLCYPYKEKGRG